MKPEDFVYDQIYKGALSKGASDRCAKDSAVIGIDEYRKNKIVGKVSNLIEARIKAAVKQSGS